MRHDVVFSLYNENGYVKYIEYHIKETSKINVDNKYRIDFRMFGYSTVASYSWWLLTENS